MLADDDPACLGGSYAGGFALREPRARSARPWRALEGSSGIVKVHGSRWRIESGKAGSITDLAAQEDVTDTYVCRLLLLTCLAPDIVEAILDGRQPKGLKSGSRGSLHWS